MTGPESLRPCAPPWWARSGHAQTLLGYFLSHAARPPAWERLNLVLEDGDTLRIRLARGTRPRVVYLFHGLGGDADRDYMVRAAARFASLGDTIVAVNHRGAGEGRGAARRPYHSGIIGDAATVLRMGRGFFPDHQHLAIGYSLSGNLLLLLAGQDAEGELAKPDAIIAVNPPADLDACSVRMERGINRLYDLRFVHLLRKEIEGRYRPGPVPAHFRIPALATLRDFDRIFTAPAGGFQDRADYYARCSCGPHLAKIRIPTVILSATDDPIAPAADVLKFPRSSAVRLHIEASGGHVGYITRDRPDRRWLEEALEHFAGSLAPPRP